MMVFPKLKGAAVAKEWQPMSEEMWNGPISSCNCLIAENNGRSGHPVHNPAGRGGNSAINRAISSSETGVSVARTASSGSFTGIAVREAASRNRVMPSSITCPVYSPAIGMMSLPYTRV